MKLQRASSIRTLRPARRLRFTISLLVAAATAGLALAGGGLPTAVAAPKDFFAGPVLKNADARGQCAAAVLPGANFIYYSDTKALHAAGFYQAAQARAAQAPKPTGSAATNAEKMRPLLDLMKKDLSLVIATCDARALDFSSKPDPSKFPFVAAFAVDRPLTAADVNAMMEKSGEKPGTITDYNGYQVLTDPKPGNGPVLAIGFAPAGAAATTAFVGSLESVKGALDRLKSGQAVSLAEMQTRISEIIAPNAQSWLFFAPPAGSLAGVTAMAGPSGEDTPAGAALAATSRMNALGLSITATESLTLRLQGSFANPEDASTVRQFLEDVAISMVKLTAANKLPKMPRAVETLRTEQIPGSSVAGLSTQVEVSDLDYLPPDALRMFY
ncbi:MAG: hypothetical protein JO295_11200 [Verrucomicrobia bacterium]|nr:hypothetical protein [Verrucomicrobiota bacterium]